ncbi:MAG: hypothetical protein E7588_02880 [Ruminococcaceae bacterium]|nr:hypothetical protein [Oscillospiraceae bacterium]
MNITLDTLRKEEEVALKLRSLYENLGYKKFKMAKFEEYSFYVENMNFLQSHNIIAFNDANGRLMALKPDVTLSIVKNTNAAGSVTEKLYYNENVYRMNMQGREYKEINQTGLEVIGNITPYTTLEVVNLAAKSLEIIHNDYILDVSHMGYVMGMLDELVQDDNLKSTLVKCITKKNLHELEKACKENEISDDTTKKLGILVSLSGSFAKTLEKARAYVLNQRMQNALDELETLLGTNTSKMRLDFSIINDMSYYNGIIFQGYVAPVPKAVLSGGRYDNLLQKMGKSKLCAIGFAVYFDEFDRYFKAHCGAKTDVVILYNQNTDLAELWAKTAELSEKGSVLVLENLPENVEYLRTEDMRK